MNILSVGSGKLLSPLFDQWRQNDHDLTVLARSSRRDTEGYRYLRVDLLQPFALPEESRWDLVVVALTPPSRDEEGYSQIYGRGVRNLVDALKQVDFDGQVLFVSSTAVYPTNSDHPMVEAEALPASFRGEWLLKAESQLQSGEWATTSLRAGGVYGPSRSGRVLRYLQPEYVEGVLSNKRIHRIHEQDLQGLICYLITACQQGKVLPEALTVVDGNPKSVYELSLGIKGDVKGIAPETACPVQERGFDTTELERTGYQLRHPDPVSAYKALLS